MYQYINIRTLYHYRTDQLATVTELYQNGSTSERNIHMDIFITLPSARLE